MQWRGAVFGSGQPRWKRTNRKGKRTGRDLGGKGREFGFTVLVLAFASKQVRFGRLGVGFVVVF